MFLIRSLLFIIIVQFPISLWAVPSCIGCGYPLADLRDGNFVCLFMKCVYYQGGALVEPVQDAITEEGDLVGKTWRSFSAPQNHSSNDFSNELAIRRYLLAVLALADAESLSDQARNAVKDYRKRIDDIKSVEEGLSLLRDFFSNEMLIYPSESDNSSPAEYLNYLEEVIPGFLQVWNELNYYGGELVPVNDTDLEIIGDIKMYLNKFVVGREFHLQDSSDANPFKKDKSEENVNIEYGYIKKSSTLIAFSEYYSEKIFIQNIQEYLQGKLISDDIFSHLSDNLRVSLLVNRGSNVNCCDAYHLIPRVTFFNEADGNSGGSQLNSVVVCSDFDPGNGVLMMPFNLMNMMCSSKGWGVNELVVIFHSEALSYRRVDATK